MSDRQSDRQLLRISNVVSFGSLHVPQVSMGGQLRRVTENDHVIGKTGDACETFAETCETIAEEDSEAAANSEHAVSMADNKNLGFTWRVSDLFV